MTQVRHCFVVPLDRETGSPPPSYPGWYEGFEFRGGVVEMVEDAEDIAADACKAQCADSGCYEEEFRCG
jgi:hypothetical protein